MNLTVQELELGPMSLSAGEFPILSVTNRNDTVIAAVVHVLQGRGANTVETIQERALGFSKGSCICSGRHGLGARISTSNVK